MIQVERYRILISEDRYSSWVTGGWHDDLDCVGELHTLDDLWQLVVAAQVPPAFLCGVCTKNLNPDNVAMKSAKDGV
jgi:hypothetical protein